MFKKFRIAVLVYALILVAGGAWLTRMRSTNWDETLWVLVYPINGDGSEVVSRYIDALDRISFEPLHEFFAKQARQHALLVKRPFSINVAQPLNDMPPAPPLDGNTFAIMWWSLQLRLWAWQVEWSQDEPEAHIQVFVVYHDPAERSALPHSLGLQKGLIGVVHAFASKRMTQSNNVVIAHELLHTVGATDKYDPSSGLPQFPHGFAEPERDPLYPQRRAEVMGGRIPLERARAAVPRSLKSVMVGPQTALEINWRTH